MSNRLTASENGRRIRGNNTLYLTMNASSNLVILLFDEFGTPTFRDDRPIDTFLGVSVAYKNDDEEYIFQQCDTEFGLSNTKPVKNNRISETRADKISRLVVGLPLQVTMSSMALSNETLQQDAILYEALGTEIRKQHRGVGPRKVAQILHDQILDDTIFASITQYLDNHQASTDFDPYIDDWAIPECDIDIALKYRSESLAQKITELHRQFGSEIVIHVSPIKRMSDDSKRKRFIDVATSAISRSFFPCENQRYSPTPLRNILSNQANRCDDVTNRTIEFLRKAMDEFSRNPSPT